MKSIESEINDLNKQLLQLRMENDSLKELLSAQSKELNDIKNSSNVENLFKISEFKYQKLIDVLPLGITITDKEGNIIESNKKAEELLGLTKEEQLRRKISGEEWKIITSDGRDFPQDEFASVKALRENRTIENVEMGIVRGNNNITWINVSATPLSIDNIGLVIAYSDITDRKNTENELNSYFSNALDLFCIVDFEGRFKKLNREWENCLGFRLDELINTKFMDYIHPDDYHNTIEATKKLEFDKSLFNFTNRYRTKDGSYKVIEWKAYQNENQIYAAARDITDRINIEISLKNTNEYLENLINYANAPIIVWDTDFKITRFNHAFEFLTGYKESQVIGKKLDLLFPPELSDEYLKLIYNTLKGERWETVEIKILQKDKSIRTVLWNSATIFEADGVTPIATIAQGQDITGRKDLELELKESEEFLKKGEEIGNFGYWVLHVDTDLMTVSESARKIMGLNDKENPTDQIKRMVLPEYIPLMKKAFEDAVLNLAPYDIEEKIQRESDGKIIDIHSKAEFDTERRVLFGTIQDITDRKRIEESLRETNQYLENLINYANAPIIVWDTEFRITRFNPAFELLTGYSEKEVLGEYLDILFPKDLSEDYSELTIKTIAGERWETVEIKILHKDKSIKTVLWNSATLFEKDGKTPIGAIAQGQDITERKAIEKAFFENEEKFRLIIENTSQAIVFSDPNGITYFANKAASNMFGYTLDEFKSLQRYGIIDLNDNRLWQALKDREINGKFSGELNLIKKDGTIFPGEITSNLFIDSNGIKRTSNLITDISERKLAEQQLKKSQEDLEFAQKIAKLGSWSWDMKGNKVSWSKEMFIVFDIDPEDYDENPEILISRIHPEDLHLFLNNMNSNLECGNSPNLEYRVVHRDGSIHYISAEGRYTFDEFGKPIYSVGTAQDITERKIIEESLRKTNAYLENLINYANAPIIVWDTEFNITRFNHAFEYLTGFKENDVIGKKLDLLFPPELSDEYLKLIYKTLTGERWETVEIKILRKDKSIKTVLWNSATLFEADGKTPIATIAQGQDITERKLAENEIRKQEAFLRALTDNLPGMVGYWSNDLVCKFANKIYMDWFGKTYQEMQGINLKDLMDEELFNLSKPNIDKVLSGEKVSFERTLIKPDGSIGYTWAHYIPDVQKNEVVGFYVLVNDITELKEAAVKLEELNNNLQELNATKDKFFSIIAHDLRNPIGSFKQITKLLHESYDDLSEEELLEFLEVIKKSSNNIYTLLENLLEWSKSQRGKLVLDPIELNLYSMTENIVQLYQSIADDKQVKIVNNIKKTINIFADNNLMSTIFRNLINNSVKFSNANGIVTLDSFLKDEYIQISISDNGVGMTSKQIENLFKIDKSITTLGTKKEKGTGLGLIICKEFVEKHKGKIWVESEVGVGSTFHITLPI